MQHCSMLYMQMLKLLYSNCSYLGCPNTPGKGSRFCKLHNGLARPFIDEKNLMENDMGKGVSTNEDLLIKCILSNKVTRQGNFCEVCKKPVQNINCKIILIPSC